MCYGSEVECWSIIDETKKRSDSTRNTHQIKLLFLECCSEDQINQAKLLVRGLHIYVSILGGFVASLATSEEVIP